MNPEIPEQLLSSLGTANDRFARRWNSSRTGDKGKKLLRRLSAGRDFILAGQEYGYDTIEGELELHRDDFNKAVQQAKTLDDVYVACAGHVEIELHRLFYETNDLPMARLKRDYFEDCMASIVKELRHSPQFTPEWEERFARLRPAYDFGLQSYGMLRREIAYVSEHDTRSLMGFCWNTLTHMRRENPQEDIADPNDIDALGEEAEGAAWRLLAQYDIQSNDGPPHPALFGLVDLANHAANAKVQAQYPNKKLEQLKAQHGPELEAALRDNVKAFMDMLGRYEQYDGILMAKAMLENRLYEAANISPDFMAIKTTAIRSADACMRAGTEAGCARYANDRRWIEPKTAWRHEQTVPHIYAHGSLAKQSARNLPAINGALEVASSPLSSLSILEAVCDEQTRQVFLRGAHPALLLGVADYMAEYRRIICEDLAMRGHDAGEFSREVRAIEAKCHAGYESYLATQDLLMQATHGAHDSLYAKQVLRFVDDTGREPKEIGLAEEDGLADECHELLQDLHAQYGVPDAWRGQPLLGALYERCHEQVAAEAEQHQAGARGYREILSSRDEQPDEKVLHRLALARMKECLSLVEPQPQTHDGHREISGNDWQAIVEYLDSHARYQGNQRLLN